MQNNFADVKEQTQDSATANIMLTELNNIRARHQWIIKRSAEISALIEIFGRRQDYVKAALEESRKMAEEIGQNAKRRVDKVMTNAHRIIEPQKAQIIELERRIAELKDELKSKSNGETERLDQLTLSPESDYSGIESPYSEYSYENESYDQQIPAATPLGQICALELNGGCQTDNSVIPQEIAPASGIDPDTLTPEQIKSYIDRAAGLGIKGHDPMDTPASPTEFLMHGPYNIEGVAAASGSEKADLPPQNNNQRQFSLREPENEETFTYQSKNCESTEPVETFLQTALKKEYSLREQPAESTVEHANEPTDIPNTPPMSVIAGENHYSRILLQSGQSIPPPLTEETESPNIMHLDVFIDTRHHHNNDSAKCDVHNHRWQIKVEVEVPQNKNHEIGYGQVLAALTATLSRFDNVLLNDIFPFDHIQSSHENIASYFFNCLEDTLVMKELRLIEVGLWEKQSLVIQVRGRNRDFDELLKGEDILERTRGSLFREASEGDDTSFKKMLGMMFKGKN